MDIFVQIMLILSDLCLGAVAYKGVRENRKRVEQLESSVTSHEARISALEKA